MSSSSGNSLNAFLSRCDIGNLYNYTSRVILELALLGYTDVAGRLLSSLNNHDFYHDRFGSLRSLWFLWNLHARADGVSWPEGEEEKVRQAVRKRRAKTKGDDTRTEDDETITPDDVQEELKLFAKDFATKWYYPIGMPDSDRAVAFNTHKLDRPSTTAQMLDYIRDIIHSFEIARPVAKIRDVRSGLVSALDMVLLCEAYHEQHPRDATLRKSGAPTSYKLLHWLAHSLGEQSYETQPAMESWQVWKLYKRGALRQQFDIDEAALANFAQDFEHTVTKRLANGRSKLRSNLSVQELLKAVEYNTQTNPKARQYSNANEQPPETSLFNAPAIESQIEEAEARLNITLPSDYKAFLRFSNGFGSAWGHPLGDFQTPLHSVDKLRWLDPTEEDYFTDLSLDLPTRWDKWPFAPPPTAKAYACDDVSEHFLIGRALEIGTQEIDNTWLLPPSTIMPIKQAVKKMLDDGSLGEREKNSVRAAIRDFAGSEEEWEEMEWACATWASGGVAAMYVYPGFRTWLEDVVEKGKVGLDGEEEEEKENLFKRGMWLGRVFETRESGGKFDADGDGEELPGWLKDAIRAAMPTRR
ncbi:hypothetical protein BKA58DRAFT_459879 [Alternaria rosae]|uniref:uncharacterized protein n=1 Tax=Alternaria rosae TaxID=1187941 RepID=UPI001E8E343A|nr:uncharacterized protein BKA58DRAFT_453694 [Alternaria rosae]XP_046022944.1 uncharacterized protein BKA58DRAFT_459879 [Alternaria rosae]KAH6844476.1 hypothetical protein BKA58DRAFT_453694 [Alternaria rosae]KAH6866292.1 hypothetical protein BKA58DRAFT_459879 [Alternaria rosae]